MMANVITLCLFFIISNLLSLACAAKEHNGLSIKLIHSDWPESPFYHPNLTYTQKLERLFNQSNARLKHLTTSDLKNPTDLRTKISVDRLYSFMAQIGVGSFLSTKDPFKTYYFDVDTGSDLTWVECKDCKRPGHHCLRRNSQPFPNDISSSYDKLYCNPRRVSRHPLCDPRNCIGELCAYHVNYADGSTSIGYLAMETFTFDTIPGAHRMKERVHNIVFGCGIDINMPNPNNLVAGVLCLGRGSSSFIHQLDTRSSGKFSYCLPRMSQPNNNTFLQFGEHIPTSRAIHRTPLVPYPGKSFYYVNLIGISVAGSPLNVTERDFARKSDNTGGCIMDSGSGTSHLFKGAYLKLKEKLEMHFAHIPGMVHADMGAKQFCYKRNGAKQGFKNLPTITFHFRGADHQLEPENIFFLGEMGGKETFCLTIASNDRPDRITSIGAYQQANNRFIFDTKNNMLYFGPENCGRN